MIFLKETSAKNSINVDESFITLARDIKKRLIDSAEQTGAVDNTNNGAIKNLGAKQPTPSKADKKACCS